MKSVYIFLLASLSFTPAFAAQSDASPDAQAPTCSIRLSDGDLKDTDFYSNGSRGFCSGTMISPTMMVTASHCLDDVSGGSFGEFDNLKKTKSFFVAYGNSKISQPIHVQSGDSSIYATDDMRQQANRTKYTNEGTPAFRNQDLAVVKFSDPVQGYDPTVCPHLPSAAECKQVADALHDATPDRPANITANFFSSSAQEVGSGSDKKKYYIPRASTFASKVMSTSVSPGGYLIASFTSQSKVMHLRKGDSGSGLTMPTANGSVILGVQSAVFANNDSNALFAQVCPRITDTRWAQVVGPAQTQTALAQPQKQSPATAKAGTTNSSL